MFRAIYRRFDVLSVVQHTCAIFLPQLLMKGIRFDASVQNVTIITDGVELKNQEQGLIPKLLGDERRFKQVLTNLLKNAFKFTSTGKISIKVWYEASKKLSVAVTDTGIGIDLSEM